MEDKIKEILNKVPYTLLALLYLLKVGWDYYELHNSDDSALILKRNEVTNAIKERDALKDKLKKINEFNENLKEKTSELRQLTQELLEMKATLSEDLDVPAFIRSLVTEARRVDLKVSSIRPLQQVKKELYYEHFFMIQYQGVFAQLIVFLQRLSRLQKIVLVEDISIKPIGPQSARFVLLDGKIKLKTFRYSRSAADKKAEEFSREAGK